MLNMNEPNNGITFKRIDCRGIYIDGNLAAIETQNGKIERWTVKEANNTDSNKLFGLDKAI